MAETGFDLDPSSILDAGNQPVDETPVDDQPIDDQPVDDTPVDDEPKDQPAEGAEPKDGEDDEPKDGEKKDFSKGDDDVDLRKAAKEIRESLNKLREIDPKAAKQLRTALGHDLAYQETFKTPEEARVFKAQVEAVGGSEGIAQLQESAQRYQEQETLSEAGDPSLVKNYAKDFPEGFKKAAPVMLDELKSLDREAFAKVILPHLIDSLEASNLGGVLNAVKEALDGGNTDAAKKIIANISAWFGEQQTASKNLRTSAVNPAMDKLAEREKALNDREESTFTKQLTDATGQYASSKLWKSGEPYIRALPVGQQRAYFQDVVNELSRRIKGDKTFQTQETALLKSKTRDVNKIISFRNAKVDTLIPEIMAKVAGEWKLTPGAKAAAGAKPGVKSTTGGKPPVVTGAGSSPTNPLYIKDKPAQTDRDLSVKNAIDYQIAGKALMKSGPFKGKWVSWRPKQQ